MFRQLRKTQKPVVIMVVFAFMAMIIFSFITALASIFMTPVTY